MYNCPNPLPAPAKNFKIEAVVVCNDYSDFLRNTLPTNKSFFNKIVIVTSPDDFQTQKLCEFYHVECVQSKRLKLTERKFCKGAGINDGLARLDKDGWVLHMDADIWLPPLTRILLEQADLDKQMIYGIDRFNVRGWSAWHDFLNKPVLQHEAGAYIHLSTGTLPLGTRVMQNHMFGYVPIGFFQLWHPLTSNQHLYPEGHTNAGKEDILFSSRWPRSQRSFIPELIAYHLESLDAGFGTNWDGRKTRLFQQGDDLDGQG